MKNFLIVVIIIFLFTSVSFAADDKFVEHIKVVFKYLEKASSTENYYRFKESLSDAKSEVKIYSRTNKSQSGENDFLCSIAIDNCIDRFELAGDYWKYDAIDCDESTSHLDYCKTAYRDKNRELREARKLLENAYKVCFPKQH